MSSIRILLSSLRLRTKFLISLVLIIAGLCSAALLAVKNTLARQAHQQSATSAHDSLVTFQTLRSQQGKALRRKADLLATLADVSDYDAEEFKNSVQNPLDASQSDLSALADRDGKILAMHAADSRLSVQELEQLLESAKQRGASSDWWVIDSRLYQVELQRVDADAGAPGGARTGTVIVGLEVDKRAAQDLGDSLSSQIVFWSKGQILASTLDPGRESKLSERLLESKRPDRVRMGDEEFFVSSAELAPGLAGGVNLTVLKSDRETVALLSRLNRFLLGLGVVAVLAGGFIAFVISDTYTVPLRSLVKGVRALEQGDFKYRLHAQGGDEVAQVTRAFDRMRQTLEKNAADQQLLEEQLLQSQKMEALGQLAGGVAHDFNNLLTIIKGNNDLLLDALRPAESAYKNSAQIGKAADRAAALTRQLLIFSRRQALQPKILNLNELLLELGKLLGRLIREDVQYEFKAGTSLGHFKADPGQVEQVVLNLVVNACDAMPNGGMLKVASENAVVSKENAEARPTIPPGCYVMLSVSDTGCGMDEGTKARIFEPFFTTKETGKGTGLGLSTVYGVVKQSDGYIWVESAPGQGTRFEIYFPCVNEKQNSRPKERTGMASARAAATLLVVEDEIEVRELTSTFLESAGYNVVAAQDSLEALHIVQEMGSSIQGIVTDVVMPKLKGTELGLRVREILPEVKIVYMSGYLEHGSADAKIVAQGFFVQKPFTREQLVTAVGDALQARTEAMEQCVLQ